ncbi:hypothetical protein AB6A40_005589 [Gnathostoma spinigerum]|uniref:DNA mismatch repair protein S5 domain-containing protein n=1 Tax=Gnathostoma spinigerum TaxID=75299 RepID=A0ABD6EH12_9BILA
MSTEVSSPSSHSSGIRSLPPEVCRRLTTSQVVITLSGACKELVDNALDADANVIEIRVNEFGAESLEVIDNGSGIHSSNFDLLCKSHSTSKLNTMSDFRSLTTFGFRGEALNALCAISTVIITTRHNDEQIATRLTFDHKGNTILREKCARTVGTSIVVRNLFETLPVRRKEFERKSKKEFCLLLTAVQSFALTRLDVRFTVASICGGKRHQALLTPGGKASIKDVMAALFGVRTEKQTVLEIVQDVPTESVCSLYGVTLGKNTSFDDIKLSGYVSSCEHGHGRNSNDRQFVYVNGRPVDYPKLCRIANDVYQLYNRGQYCMLILYLDLPPDAVDVNVSPDKRTVFFEREKDLFAVLRASLLATFAPILGRTGSVDTPTASQFTKGPGTTFCSQPNAAVDYCQIRDEDPLDESTGVSQVAPVSQQTESCLQSLPDVNQTQQESESTRKRRFDEGIYNDTSINNSKGLKRSFTEIVHSSSAFADSIKTSVPSSDVSEMCETRVEVEGLVVKPLCHSESTGSNEVADSCAIKSEVLSQATTSSASALFDNISNTKEISHTNSLTLYRHPTLGLVYEKSLSEVTSNFTPSSNFIQRSVSDASPVVSKLSIPSPSSFASTEASTGDPGTRNKENILSSCIVERTKSDMFDVPAVVDVDTAIIGARDDSDDFVARPPSRSESKSVAV